MSTVPAKSFAGSVAECLVRRQTVDLYTVVRAGDPQRVPVGAKVICPEREAPRVFGASAVHAQRLCALLPATDVDRWTGLKQCGEPASPVWIYGERVYPPLQCIVAGAGHVGRELAQLGAALGWSVTVADDRSDYATSEGYPAQVSVLCIPFHRLFEEVRADGSTAVVLVTRGHKHDEELLRQIAGGPAFYVGMIGSRRRVLRVLAQLKAEGLSDRWLEKLYAPIGLPLGADSPAEIALAVAAEIMAVWKGRGAWARREKEAFYSST